MRKYIVLHGHFYQPPREDPWWGIIDYQESAAPFTDWNRRITAECYAAGTASRVLDGSGKILALKNNYKTLSWNFGPTLLSWLENEVPNIYSKILEADAESAERLGFGNGVAQSYNHTILPLDRPEDARTQIIWGLTDFRRRFGRDADGLWLPECAVNTMVVDILIEQGLSYVILSPWQASAIRTTDGGWTKLEGKPAPSNRPFEIRRPGGSIAVFFYDPDLASGISFGHLLRSREGLERALKSALETSGGPLVSIATDGEIYGHHEPFGDMCLAALTDSHDDELVFTNYAAYLAENPPTEEVQLHLGDEGLGSSWSCAHGVGRWMKDCGCSTGGEEGWNQKWRAPLRRAFDRLRNRAEKIWMEKTAELTGDSPRQILNQYGKVLAGQETPKEFSGRVLRAADEKSTELLEALEGAKYLQFMYTSCGWFFSEISGIEPVQNIRYAYRAAELLDRDGRYGLEKELRKSLAKVPSNIPEKGSGADILDRDVIPRIQPDTAAAAAVFWRNLYNLPEVSDRYSGDLKMESFNRRTVAVEAGCLSLEGHVEFSRKSTLRRRRYRYKTTVDRNLYCPEITISENGRWATVPISAMPRNLRSDIQETLLRRSEKKLRKLIGSQALPRLRDMKMVRELDLPVEDARRQSLELSLHFGPILAMRRLKKASFRFWPEVLSILEEILDHRKDYGLNWDNAELENRAGNLVSDVAEKLLKDCSHEAMGELVDFLAILHRYGLKPLKPFVQNMVYALIEQRFEGKDIAGACGIGGEDLLALADMMNINPERFLPKKEN